MCTSEGGRIERKQDEKRERERGECAGRARGTIAQRNKLEREGRRWVSQWWRTAARPSPAVLRSPNLRQFISATNTMWSWNRFVLSCVRRSFVICRSSVLSRYPLINIFFFSLWFLSTWRFSSQGGKKKEKIKYEQGEIKKTFYLLETMNRLCNVSRLFAMWQW